MKTLNKQIFLAYPIALMAAVVGMNKGTSDSDYKLAAKRVADYFNNLEKDSTAVIGSFPCLPSFSRKELRMILTYVRNLFGRITSFVATKLGAEKSIYKMKCAMGSFKMILKTNAEKNITYLAFKKENNLKLITG